MPLLGGSGYNIRGGNERTLSAGVTGGLRPLEGWSGGLRPLVYCPSDVVVLSTNVNQFTNLHLRHF